MKEPRWRGGRAGLGPGNYKPDTSESGEDNKHRAFNYWDVQPQKQIAITQWIDHEQAGDTGDIKSISLTLSLFYSKMLNNDYASH